MPEQRNVVTDLIAEGDEIDAMVAGLDSSQWALPTPAPRWTIAHQIAHLTATFQLAATAASNPPAFQRITSRLSDDFDANVAAALAPYLAHPPAVLLDHWRTERAAAERALAAVPGGQLVPWLVRPLPAPVLAAAGMMELFGHGQDIADALRIRRQPTDRLEHLVAFAVRTWDFGYLARGMKPPEVAFGFEITAPSGAVWRHGPAQAEQRITGPAVDLCLLVTRRRHRADLALTATGPDADQWLDIAQAYRGPAGPGRLPGQFGKGEGNMTTSTPPTTTAGRSDPDRAAIAALPGRLTAAWAAHDANAFADLFTEDGTMILPGHYRKGREEIREFMAAGFAGRYKGSRVTGQPIDIKQLGTGAAALITQGGVLAPGQTDVSPAAAIRASWIVVKRNSQWLLAVYQNCPRDVA